MSVTAAQTSVLQSAAMGLRQMAGGVYPTAVSNPRGLIYDGTIDYCEKPIDDSPRPVTSLEVPGLHTVRQQFYRSMISDPALYPYGRRSLVLIHQEMQTAVDEAVEYAEKVARCIRHSTDYYWEIPRVARDILNASSDSYGFLRSAVVLLTPSSYSDHYRSLAEQARDQLKQEARSRKEDDPDAAALLLSVAWAAHASTSNCVWKGDKRSLWYYGGNYELLGVEVIDAWEEALLPKPGMDDSYRVLAGLQACMSRGKYARMAPFLDRLTFLFPKTADENKLRLAWAMIAEARSSLSRIEDARTSQGKAMKKAAHDSLRLALRLLRSVIREWKYDTSRTEQVAALKEQAREIGRMLKK